MKPQDGLFNWPVRKDSPGTVKPQLPRIVVSPPPMFTKPIEKRKKRATNLCQAVSTPKKLTLDPSFWSQNEMDTTRPRKQRFLFRCRRAECSEMFSSAKRRDIHEGHCLTFDEVYIKCIYSKNMT